MLSLLCKDVPSLSLDSAFVNNHFYGTHGTPCTALFVCPEFKTPAWNQTGAARSAEGTITS